MNAAEARAKLTQNMSQNTDKDYPLVWVGDMIEETPEAFIFEATVYKEHENPRDDYLDWAVDKATGSVSVVNFEWVPPL
ncbi:MAG: hypothetical protein LBB60_02655 [Desulfovibrio sp.]|nr:hypothetical protein [Desulfovibrio sp.]